MSKLRQIQAGKQRLYVAVPIQTNVNESARPAIAFANWFGFDIVIAGSVYYVFLSREITKFKLPAQTKQTVVSRSRWTISFPP